MRAQIIDSDYIMVNDRPVVRLFCRDEDGKPVCVTKKDFLPYFYVKSDKEDELRKRLENVEGNPKVERVEKIDPIGYNKEKEPFLKVTLTNPSKVSEVRETVRDLGSLFESDILFPYRFMADTDIKGMGWIEFEGRPIKTSAVKVNCIEATEIKEYTNLENSDLKTLSFDMETNQPMDRGPMPGEDPIIMISASFSHKHDGKDTAILVARKTKEYDDVKSYDGEKEMLEAFSRLIDDYDPDIITGYNINGFDFPALLGRMEKYNVRRTIGRTTDKQAWCRNVGQITRCTITGRIIADCYAIVKKNSAQDSRFKFRRFDLNTVATNLLGEEKHDMDWKKMHDMYLDEKGIKTVIDYARQDAILPLRMLEERNLLGQFMAIARIAGINLQDVLDSGQSPRIEQYLLREFNRKGFLLPERPSQSAERDYEGGLVLEPEKGLHADGCILVLDFKSLYPSIIRTFNICSTTLTEDMEISDEAPTGAKFVRSDVRRGIIPDMVDTLVSERGKVKKEMTEAEDELRRILDSKQFALKTMANSIYGYLGYARAKIYRVEIAGAITAYARELLQSTKEVLEKKNLKIVYGDTDSVMVHIDTKNLDEAKEIGDELADEITGNLPGVLELEFEKIFRTFLIIAKKRYAAWAFEPKGDGWKDKIDMKGIETVRRDWCPIVSETQMKVLEILLKEGDVKKAIDVVKKEVENIQEGKVDIEKLAITKGITKKIESYDGKLPHIEVAKKMAQRDPRNAPTAGQRISYVITVGSGVLSDKAESIEYIREKGLKIDSDYYIENQLIPPVERIFSAVEVKKEELMGNGRQKSLHEVLTGHRHKRNHDTSVQKSNTSLVKKVEGFVCNTCEKQYRRVTLNGKCRCGGEILAHGNGEIGKKVVV